MCFESYQEIDLNGEDIVFYVCVFLFFCYTFFKLQSTILIQGEKLVGQLTKVTQFLPDYGNRNK